MKNQLIISDIYLGRPDAKDEVVVEGIDNFIESFIVPSNLDADSMFNNSQCFVSGYKGTGKTALLYYLENYFHNKDKNAISVFIPFKEDYNEVKRKNMANVAQRIVSRLSINQQAQNSDDDFEYIWAWELFKILIDANGKNKGKLFVFDGFWKEFKRIIKLIDKDNNITRLVLKPSITFDPNSTQLPLVSASIETEEASRSDAYQKFVTLIDSAYEQLKFVTRTDVPFFIFIDELEAYYGNPDIFKRDLRMIRDLLFTTKRINMIFWKKRAFNTKFICAFRTEVLNAINRFVIPKEINKSVSGFEVSLRWNYNNTNSIEHPIMKILLRRIQMTEHSNGNDYSEAEIFKKWFPEKYDNEDSVCYILNYTWNKPRDIVRLLMSAQNSIKSTSSSFSKDVLDSIIKIYSTDSLNEIREEMRAVYTNKEIEDILQCFKGFRVVFSNQDIKQHLAYCYADSIILKDTASVLRNLYRLGLMGNYSKISNSFHWQHKGDDELIISDEWQIQVHRALWGALQISRRHDNAVRSIDDDLDTYSGNVVSATVKKIEDGYAGVAYQIGQEEFYGIILKKDVSTQFVNNISDYLQIGCKTDAKIITYDKSHGNWTLTRNFDFLI